MTCALPWIRALWRSKNRKRPRFKRRVQVWRPFTFICRRPPPQKKVFDFSSCFFVSFCYWWALRIIPVGLAPFEKKTSCRKKVWCAFCLDVRSAFFSSQYTLFKKKYIFRQKSRTKASRTIFFKKKDFGKRGYFFYAPTSHGPGRRSQLVARASDGHLGPRRHGV